MTDEQIATAKSEFFDARSMYIESLHLANESSKDFLNVKLAFVAFISIIFTITLGKEQLFSRNFIVIIAIINFLTFLLILNDFWFSFGKLAKSKYELEKSAILANIRYISALKIKEHKNTPNSADEKKFHAYGIEAEKRNKNQVILVKDIENNKPIENILIDYVKQASWKLNFILWAVLIAMIPILFVISILKLV